MEESDESFRCYLSSDQFDTIGQIAITVDDLAGAKDFYQNILGMKFLFDAGHLAFLQCGNVRLMFTTPEKPEPRGGTILYYKVGDIQATCAAIKRSRRLASRRAAPDCQNAGPRPVDGIPQRSRRQHPRHHVRSTKLATRVRDPSRTILAGSSKPYGGLYQGMPSVMPQRREREHWALAPRGLMSFLQRQHRVAGRRIAHELTHIRIQIAILVQRPRWPCSCAFVLVHLKPCHATRYDSGRIVAILLQAPARSVLLHSHRSAFRAACCRGVSNCQDRSGSNRRLHAANGRGHRQVHRFALVMMPGR